jgi:hypothetical protein
MDNNIAVKFLHPGRETPKSFIKNGFCHWKNKPKLSKKQLHARKYIITDGDYLTSLDHKVSKGQIGFWGEWEAESLVKENVLFGSVSNTKSNNYPEYFHTPLKPDKTPKSINPL